jgi:transcriptional regulator with GAF, ATPase, and Fis domain
MTSPPGSTGLGGQQGVRLAETFVALADALVDDYDVVEVMDQLVRACVDVLDVAAAGLLLVDQRGGLQVVASSSEEVHLLELFQLQDAEGPCLDCVRSGAAVTVHDLRTAAARWPRFVEEATRVGYGSVYAVPMRLRQEVIGGLNLFRRPGLTLDRHEEQLAQALADVATIGVLQQRMTHRALLLAEQLQTALDSRIVVEQAKGVLAEYGGLSMDDAYRALRGYARDHNRKLSEIADSVVHGQLPLAAMVAPARGRGRPHSDRR